MKRIVAIIILLACFAVAKGQQSYWTPGVPPGSASFSPTFRGKAGTTDSLNHFYISMGNKWYELPTYPKLWFYPDTVYFKGTGSAPSDPFTLNLSNTPTATNNFLLAKNSNGYIVPINANFSTSTNTIIFNGIKINANGGLQTNAPIASGAGTFLKQNTSTGLVEKDTASYLPYYTASGYRVIKGLPLKIYPQVSLYNTPTGAFSDSVLEKNGNVVKARKLILNNGLTDSAGFFQLGGAFRHDVSITSDNGQAFTMQLENSLGMTQLLSLNPSLESVQISQSDPATPGIGGVFIQSNGAEVRGEDSFGNRTAIGVEASGSTGIYLQDGVYSKGALYTADYSTNGKRYNLWVPNWGAVKSRIDSAVTASVGVTSVSGTTNRVTSTGGATPVIDISSTFEALLEKVANKTATASTSTTTYPNWLGVENYVASQIPSTPSLQSVATVGNSYTGQIQAQSLYASGTGGNGYIDIPIQSTSPASTTNRLKIYADSVNRLSWKNSIYRRTIQVPYPSDYTIRMPYRVTGTTLEDSSFTAATYALKFAGTGYSKYASGTLSYITAIPNADLANSSTTINGTSIALGASGTVTAAAGTLTGTSLATNVVNSSLTNVGILTGLTVTGNVFANGSTASVVTLNGTSLNNTHGQNFLFFAGNTANASSTQDQMIAVGGVIYSGSGTHLGLTRSYEGAYFDQGGIDTVHYEFDAVKPVMTSGTIIKHAYFHTATDAGAISGVTTNYAILSESGSPSSFGGSTTINGAPSTISNTASIIAQGYNLGTNSTTPVGNYGYLLLNSNANFTGNARPWAITNAYNGNSFAIAYGTGATTAPVFNSSGVITTGTVGFSMDRTGVVSIPQLSSAGIVLNSAAGVISTGTALPSGTTAVTQSALDNSTKVATTAYVDAIGSTAVTAIGVTTANGVSGSSSGGTTPNLTITLGAITPTTVVANSGAWNGSLANNLYIGTATGITHQTNALVLVDGAAGMGTRSVVSGTAGSNTANDAYGGLFVTGQTVTIPTGTAPLVAPLIVKNPTVTATGTITDLATIYSQGGNSAGAANWNIWAKYGVTRVSGLRIDSATLTFNSVNFTGTTGTGTIVGSASPTLTGMTTLANFGTGNGIGAATNFYTQGGASATSTSNAAALVGGAAEMYYRTGLYGSTATQINPNDSYGALLLARTPIQTGSSGTSAILANLIVKAPNITVTGGSTVTDAATIYSQGAPAGATGNWNIWAKYGYSRFSGLQVDTLTASKVVFTDANKKLTSTGIGTSSQYIAGDGSLGTIGSRAHTIFTPTTGGTVNLTNNQYNIINPVGALLALTVSLPSSPANNDCVFIKFTQNVTTVTYSNGTVQDGITAPTAGGLTVLTYDGASSIWY